MANGRRAVWPCLLLGVAGAIGCVATPAEPVEPAWADVAPIFRGECNSCHGWTAGQTGNGYRFDFYDLDPCGDAALAGAGFSLAGAKAPDGTPLVAPLIFKDLVPQAGETWPRMPPQPSPALPDWEREALRRWAALPVKGAHPTGNRPPTIALYGIPARADTTLTFTAVIDDPDGDSAIGVIEANGYAFLMSRPGSFDVSFDTSAWPAGPLTLSSVLCDGWIATTNASLFSVQIVH